MAHEWFVARGGKEIGPVTAQRLKEMASSGELVPDDHVRRGDMKTPTKAGSIKGLFHKVVEPAPALPRTPPERKEHDPSGRPTQPSEPKPTPNRLPLVIGLSAGTVLLLACCGGVGLIGVLGGKTNKGREAAPEAAANPDKKGGAKGRVVIKHDGYTQVIMPELDAKYVHDKEEGQLERDIGEVPVPDISKVDFLTGPSGESIEVVKYFEVSKLEGGPETKVLRQYGHLYRNKSGRNVYHGPWISLFEGGKKSGESIYVHGALKCSNEWDFKGRPIKKELFKGDGEHTQMEYEYYDNGSYRFHGQYVNVRYIPTKDGHRVDRVPVGMHFHYYENGSVRQEEVFENGKEVGIAVFDRSGTKVLGRGKLGS